MTDQSTGLRRINWPECFPFTNIFKTFRMAISPTKLFLALAALIFTGFLGYILDVIWLSAEQPVKDEVNAYWQVANIRTWRNEVRQEQAREFRRLCQDMGGVSAEKLKKAEEEFRSDPNDAVDDALDDLDEQYTKDAEKVGHGEKARKQLAEMASQMNTTYRDLEALRRQGIFAAFLSYETDCLRQMMDAARVLNFTGWLSEVLTSRAGGLAGVGQTGGPDATVLQVTEAVRNMAGPEGTVGEMESQLLVPSVKTGPKGIGVLPSLVLMLRGFQWLFAMHWFFAVVFLLISLAIWSVFGGAICRAAALNFARDERISVKDSLAFATRKFPGFFTAPLLPLVMIAGIGLCLFIGGLFMAIPYVGEFVGGLLMGLGLVGGFAIALVVIGGAGGFSLMWPTIAVEGSDGFDAISRSYSYLYSRPWRMAFYAVIAIVYGSFCYLFARFLVLLILKGTRLFVGWGTAVFGTYRPGVGFAGADKMDAMWAHPSYEHLYSAIPPLGAIHAETIGAFFISVWVMLLVILLCAFLVSFFLSGSTVIYYLLRKEVDATDFSDVFVEEQPDETGPSLPGAVVPPAPAEPGPVPLGGPGGPGEAGSGESPPPPPPPAEPSGQGLGEPSTRPSDESVTPSEEQPPPQSGDAPG